MTTVASSTPSSTDYTLHPAPLELEQGTALPVATAKSAPLLSTEDNLVLVIHQAVSTEDCKRPVEENFWGVLWLIFVCLMASPAIILLGGFVIVACLYGSQPSPTEFMAQLAAVGTATGLLWCLVKVGHAVDEEQNLPKAVGWGAPCLVAGVVAIWELATSN